MKFLILSLLVLGFMIAPAFAEQIIFSEGKEYKIAEIIEERKYSTSPITKTQGFTTTGDTFFIFTSTWSDFEKVMFLDRTGVWQKAELRDSVTEKLIPINPVVVEEKKELHILTDQYDRVYNKQNYKFFVKTFDKSIYSGNNFDNFQGKIDGAKVSAIIVDPDGTIKADVKGDVKFGVYEGTVYVVENLWQRGWYTVDIIVEYEGKLYPEQLTFYVYGHPAPDSGTPSTP